MSEILVAIFLIFFFFKSLRPSHILCHPFSLLCHFRPHFPSPLLPTTIQPFLLSQHPLTPFRYLQLSNPFFCLGIPSPLPTTYQFLTIPPPLHSLTTYHIPNPPLLSPIPNPSFTLHFFQAKRARPRAFFPPSRRPSTFHFPISPPISSSTIMRWMNEGQRRSNKKKIEKTEKRKG